MPSNPPTTTARPALLTLLMLAIAVCVYLFNYRQPLKTQNLLLGSSVAKLSAQVSAQAAELRKLSAVAQLTPQDLVERALEERLIKTMPSPAMVYCPTSISNVMRKYQLQKTSPTLRMMIPFRDHKTLVRQNWEFTLPNNGALPIGSAMAELENSFPLAQIASFLISKNPEQPGVDAEMVVQFAVYR